MREAVGVLADDDVALLETQHALRLDAEWLDAEGLAGLDQLVPQRFAHLRRAVDLVAELADEADAQDAHRNAGERPRAHGHVGECLLREVDVGFDRADQVARARTGEVDARRRRP